jgi:prophage regulatory protein
MKLIDFKQLKPTKGVRYTRDHLRRMCKAGTFPRPIQISDRSIAWIEEEVDAWLAARAAERDTAREGTARAASAESAALLAAAPE